MKNKYIILYISIVSSLDATTQVSDPQSHETRPIHKTDFSTLKPSTQLESIEPFSYLNDYFLEVSSGPPFVKFGWINDSLRHNTFVKIGCTPLVIVNVVEVSINQRLLQNKRLYVGINLSLLNALFVGIGGFTSLEIGYQLSDHLFFNVKPVCVSLFANGGANLEMKSDIGLLPLPYFPSISLGWVF